ncbi:MAG: DUF1993 domain-containing protein [Myxococcota bacterium]
MTYLQSFSQMNKQLGQLDAWIERAAAYAQGRKVDPATFLGFRLAPDQFAFGRQVLITCDTAKLAASRLSGKAAPTFPDTEKDFDELRARIRATRDYLDGLRAEDFDSADTRVVSQPRWEGKWMTGADYFHEHALPNFYFHLAHAYALLRHNGVDLGKKDYLGALSLRDPA